MWVNSTVGFLPKLGREKFDDTHLRSIWGEIGLEASMYSQVIGESPEKTSDGVADPEDGVDQHWLVVFLTHPVVLKKDGMTKRLKMRCTSLVMVLKTLRWSKFQPWSHNLWGLPSTRLITLCLTIIS